MAVAFRKPWPTDVNLAVTQTFAQHLVTAKKYKPGYYNGGLDVAPYWSQASREIPILASADGRIAYTALSPTGYGNYVRLKHADGYETLYAHLERVSVSAGDVKAGDVLGLMGNTGNSTGKHLHFEVRLNNVPIDPEPLFKAPVITEPVITELPEFPTMVAAEVLCDLSIRSGAGTEHRRIGMLQKGDIVEVHRVIQSSPYLWLQIGHDQFCAFSNGQTFCKWRH